MTQHTHRSNRRAALLLAAAASVTSIASFTRADVVNVTWLGGAGSWNDPTKWSGGVVPNNSGSTTYRAVIPDGSVVGTGSITLDSIQLGGPATVQLASLYTSNGGEFDGVLAMIGDYTTAAPVTGTGTIDLGVPSSTGRLVGAGSIEIGSDLTVRVKRYNGSIVSGGSGPLINRGHIIGGDWDWSFAPFVSAGSYQNLGIIEAQNGALHIDGTFTRADLGELRWSNGGTISIIGTLLNQGQTLQVDAAHAWGSANGTIRGGTINIASDTRMSFGNEWTDSSSHLDDVIVNGPILVSNDDLILDRGVLEGSADVLLSTRYIARIPRLISGTGTLTIGSNVTIHGGSGAVGEVVVGESADALINHGSLRAEFTAGPSNPGNRLGVTGSSVFNDGTLSVTSSGVLDVNGGFNQPTQLTFGAGGALQVALSDDPTSGLLNVNGVLDLQTLDHLLLSPGTAEPFVYYRIVTTTGGIIGEFDSVTPGFEVEYTTNHTQIFARFVPEPSALGAGLIGLVLLPRREARRKRRR